MAVEMKPEYEGFDPTKPLSDGRVWGALARINPDRISQFTFRMQPVDTSSKNWTLLPITTKLGSPLQAHMVKRVEWPASVPAEVRKGIKGPANLLLFDEDPKSPFFGRHVEDDWTGDVLFTRTDGQDMNDLQLGHLVTYVLYQIEFPLEAMIEAQKKFGKGSQRALQARTAAESAVIDKLRPESFHAWFEGRRREYITHLPSSSLWHHTMSPVSVTFGTRTIGPACGMCLMLQGKSGQPLVKCGGCGERYYCDKICQKEEWKVHKKWCRKAT